MYQLQQMNETKTKNETKTTFPPNRVEPPKSEPEYLSLSTATQYVLGNIRINVIASLERSIKENAEIWKKLAKS